MIEMAIKEMFIIQGNGLNPINFSHDIRICEP